MPVNILEGLNDDILSLKFLPFLRAKELNAFSLVNKGAAAYLTRYREAGLGLYLSKDSSLSDPYQDCQYNSKPLTKYLAHRWGPALAPQPGAPRLTLGLKENHELLNAKTLEENLLAEAIGGWAGKRNHQRQRFFADLIRDVGVHPDLRILSNTLRMLNIYWPRRLTLKGKGEIWQPDWQGLKIFASKSDWQGIAPPEHLGWQRWVLVLENIILRERDFAKLLGLPNLNNIYLEDTWILSSSESSPRQITFWGKHMQKQVQGKFLPCVYLALAKSDLIYDPALGYGLMREIAGKQYIYSFYQSFKQPLPPNMLKNHQSPGDPWSNPSRMYLQGLPFKGLDLGMQIKIENDPFIIKGKKPSIMVQIPPLLSLSKELLQVISRAEGITQRALGGENLYSLAAAKTEALSKVKTTPPPKFVLFLEFLEIMLLEDTQLQAHKLSEFKSKLQGVEDLNTSIFYFLTDNLPQFKALEFSMGYASLRLATAPLLSGEKRVNIRQAAAQHIALNLPEDLWSLALTLIDNEVQKLAQDLNIHDRAVAIVQILENVSLDLRLERVCAFMEKLKAKLKDFQEDEQQRLKEYVCSLDPSVLALAKQEELLAALQPADTIKQVRELLAGEQARCPRAGSDGATWLLQELLSMELGFKLLEGGRSRSKSRVLVLAAKKYLAEHRSSVVVNTPAFWAWCLSWLYCCVNEHTPAQQIEGLLVAIAEQVRWLWRLELTDSQIDSLFQAGGFCLACLQSREDIFNGETVREFLQDFVPLLLRAREMNLWAEWLGIMLLYRGLSLKELKYFMQDIHRRVESLHMVTEDHLVKLRQQQNLLGKFKSIYDEEPAAFLSWGLSEQMEVFFGSPLMAAKKKTGSYRLPDEYSHLTQLLFAGREKIYKPLGNTPSDKKEPQLSYNVLYLQELASNFTRRGEEYLAAKVDFIESLPS